MKRDLKLKSLAVSKQAVIEFDLRQFSHLAFATTLTCTAILGGTNSAAANDYTPTLDKLYNEGLSPVHSSFTLSPTETTTGINIYNLPDYNPETKTVTDKYYELQYKGGVAWETERQVITDTGNLDYNGYYFKDVSSTLNGAAIRTENAIMHNLAGDF